MLRALLVMSLLMTASCATSTPLPSTPLPSATPTAPAKRVAVIDDGDPDDNDDYDDEPPPPAAVVVARRTAAETARVEGVALLAAGDAAGAVVLLQRCANGLGVHDVDLRDRCFESLVDGYTALGDEQGASAARLLLSSSTGSPSRLDAARAALARGDRALAARLFLDVVAHDPSGRDATAARQQLALLVDVEPAPPGSPLPPLGSLDPEVIRVVVREHRRQIDGCYEAQLASTPDVAGKIVMRWVIGGTGVVRLVAIASSTFSTTPILDACLVDTVRAFSFPPPRNNGIVIVNYPFVFKQP